MAQFEGERGDEEEEVVRLPVLASLIDARTLRTLSSSRFPSESAVRPSASFLAAMGAIGSNQLSRGPKNHIVYESHADRKGWRRVRTGLGAHEERKRKVGLGRARVTATRKGCGRTRIGRQGMGTRGGEKTS